MKIRSAVPEDARRIAELSDSLGYPAAIVDISDRLSRFSKRERDTVLVAEMEDRVVGWIHGSELDLLEAGLRCEILGLVVDPAFRSRGIGRALVEAVEEWARDRGLDLMSVRSNIVRPDAHPFYERLGYRQVKTQHVYRKGLIIKD